MIPLLTTAIIILVALYLTYPRYLRRRLSSARFFKDLPPPRKGRARLRLGKLRLNLPFFLQLTLLLLLLAAVYLMNKKLSGNENQGLGVWFMIDTSASMSTMQQAQPRTAAAAGELEQAIQRIQAVAKDKPVCYRISAFDLERRDLVSEGDAVSVRQAVKNLAPRPLGTDLGLIRSALAALSDQRQAQCRISHLIVITDLPAPPWLSENSDIQVLWRDIGQPVDNLGFTAIRGSRNPLTGLMTEIRLEVSAYGAAPGEASLVINDPGGGEIKNQALEFHAGGIWQGSFTPGGPGLYRLRLSPGGAYLFDDTAAIEIGKGREIRVDWQLKDRRLPRLLGWTADRLTPQLRVTGNKKTPIGIPTLIIGPGYRGEKSDRDKPNEIRDFMETSPLLEDVNFDALETIDIQGVELSPEMGFQPVLRGMDGSVWLAQRENPVSAYVPGLPTGTDDTVGRFSATVFFNALRWLLQERDLPPLYTLTAPHILQPEANRLVLHKGEGNTQRVSQSSGDLEDLKPVTGKGAAAPVWPIILMAAAIIFMIERILTISRPEGP
jgi:hypothetical protein